MQQLANAVEHDKDVEHDGRMCGRTSRYTSNDYLRSDKTALYRLISVPGDGRLGFLVGTGSKDRGVPIKRSDCFRSIDTKIPSDYQNDRRGSQFGNECA